MLTKPHRMVIIVTNFSDLKSGIVIASLKFSFFSWIFAFKAVCLWALESLTASGCYSSEKQWTPIIINSSSQMATPKKPHCWIVPAWISCWFHSLLTFYLELGEDDFESLWIYGFKFKDWCRPSWDSFWKEKTPDYASLLLLEKRSECWSIMGPTPVTCYDVGHSDHWLVVKKLPPWRCKLRYFHCSLKEASLN